MYTIYDYKHHRILLLLIMILLCISVSGCAWTQVKDQTDRSYKSISISSNHVDGVLGNGPAALYFDAQIVQCPDHLTCGVYQIMPFPLYEQQSDGSSVWTDTRIEDHFNHPVTGLISEADMSDEDHHLMESFITDVYSKASLIDEDCTFSHIIQMKSDPDYYYAFFDCHINGCRIVDIENEHFCQDQYLFNEYGIYQIQLCPRYQSSQTHDAALMSLDAALDRLASEYAEGNINKIQETISSVEVAYSLNKNLDGIIHLTPIWCFCADTDIFGNIPLICLDAVTGDILWMSGY